MKSARRTIMALLLAAASFAHAQTSTTVASYRELRQREEAVHLERVKADPRYRQTLELCRNNWREYGWVLRESALEVVLMGAAYAPAWTRSIENRGVPPEVKDLLDSEAFQRGIFDCGQSDGVIPKMAAADYAGKFLGLAATVALWRTAAPLMVRLATLGRAGAVAHRAVLLVSFAYMVQQGLTLTDIISSRKVTDQKVKDLVKQSSDALHSNVGQMKEDLENTYRRELDDLERKLTDSALAPLDRTAIEEKIARIRFVLKS